MLRRYDTSRRVQPVAPTIQILTSVALATIRGIRDFLRSRVDWANNEAYFVATIRSSVREDRSQLAALKDQPYVVKSK